MTNSETLRSNSIQQQLHSNEDANVLFSEAPNFLEIDSAFLDSLQKTVSDVSSEEMDRLITFAVDACIRKVLRINQFLQISENARQQLASIYRRTWELLKGSSDPVYILRTEHFPAIQVWVSRLYPPLFSESLRQQETIRPVCCADYSAELQLHVLGIAPDDLHDPVLDIGCGYAAPLVKYLRSRGVDVYGFDRLIEEETDRVNKADWFTYEYSAHHWGTIVSHMAFGNHYRYAVHYDEGLRQDLEITYDMIVSSLAPGGLFAYTPGVPELDMRVSPTRFQVEHTRVTEDFITSKILRFRE